MASGDPAVNDPIPNDPVRSWLATCPRGLGGLLANEIKALGAQIATIRDAQVEFSGTRADLYRVSLWSRIANRVLLPVLSGPAANADELYDTMRSARWSSLLRPNSKFSVMFSGTSQEIRDTRFGARRCKDAVMDYCRAEGELNLQPSPAEPDLSISVRLRATRVEVALDLTGESLHRRGYRTAAGAAPLKENVAAACLLRAGWVGGQSDEHALIDPLCGSATFLIEGAMIALDQAPALRRQHFSFAHWAGHHAAQWQAVLGEASARAKAGRSGAVPEIRGYDEDPRVIAKAQENIRAAGLSDFVRVSVKSLSQVQVPTHRRICSGLLVTNPPYGQRLSDPGASKRLYSALGATLASEFEGWSAAVLAPTKEQGKALGLRSHRQLSLYNGGRPVSLILLDIDSNNYRSSDGLKTLKREETAAPPAPVVETDRSAAKGSASGPLLEHEQNAENSELVSTAHYVPAADSLAALPAGAQMFANRLTKNLRRISRWRKRYAVECYRLYDADMPEYAVAVDRYADWLHISEYLAPQSVSSEDAARRRGEILSALPVVTGVPSERLVFKERARQRGRSQYEKRSSRRQFLQVREGEATLLVNLEDYLDTGLFLDHRPLRRRVSAESEGCRVLNLFCYTGALTVHAALGGARSTDSVDLSNTYLRWLSENLAVNGFGESHHRRHNADVLKWLQTASHTYDLILVDPPTFSNSSKLAQVFDLQRDHARLLHLAMARLEPRGRLYFSNNARSFKLDSGLVERYGVREITRQTIDPDFQHSKRPPHRCWTFEQRP
ncbi:MAG: bifunctional 23S rRNA (guanine(2069)-N(7))-methyltransferase RlmK/23S rRNA (guanine(2445)-N(2))-methyltransferase RlmL [Pseudomonadota bacterium]